MLLELLLPQPQLLEPPPLLELLFSLELSSLPVPLVLPLGLGDAAIIATGPRPVRGAAGFYRVHLRHAISRVHRGGRLGLELLLHDAPQATDAGRWL